MKKLLPILTLLLVACTSKEGLTEQSTKYPTGNPNSSIVVTEFADLQCPACRGAHEQIVKPLLEQYGQNIRYEFKHMPLRQIHAYAQEAAEATECAADQQKFWEFIDDTYDNQEKLSRDDLIARAEKIGVEDMDLFKRCVQSRINRDAVQADYEEGVENGVSGTPTFFFNGERVPRNNLEVIGGLIDEAAGNQRL